MMQITQSRNNVIRFTSWFSLMLILMSFSAAASAVSSTDNLLSLYQKALQYDAQYKARVADTEAEKEEINKAKAQFLPKVQLSASAGRGVTDRTTETLANSIDTHLIYDTKNYALSVKQPLFNKEIFATYKSAEANIKNKEELLREENANLITRITTAYFETLYAEEKVTVTQDKIKAVTQQLNQAKHRLDRGQGTITEVSEAQTNLDLAEAELIEADNSLDSFKQSLGNITGQAIGNIAKLNPESLPRNTLDSEPLEYWLEKAENNNHDIASARYALEVAQQEIEKKQAGHYPTLDLVGVRSYSENDSNNTIGSKFDTTTLALQLNVPLFAGGYVNANVRQSVNRLTAAEEELNFKTRDVNANIRKYFNSINSEFLSIQAYKQAVQSSEMALIGTQKAFEAGIRTNIEVLNAQQKLFSSKLNLSKAQYMLVNNIVNIKRTAGLLNEAQLQSLHQYFTTN